MFIAEILMMYFLASVFVIKEPFAFDRQIAPLQRGRLQTVSHGSSMGGTRRRHAFRCSGTAVWTVTLRAVRFCRHQTNSFWPMGTEACATEGFLRDSRMFGTSESVNPTVPRHKYSVEIQSGPKLLDSFNEILWKYRKLQWCATSCPVWVGISSVCICMCWIRAPLVTLEVSQWLSGTCHIPRSKYGSTLLLCFISQRAAGIGRTYTASFTNL